MNKKGQFYLVATVIIAVIVLGLAVTLNYSLKGSSYEAEEIAKELRIEGEKVLDYDAMDSGGFDNFYTFSRDYSKYVGDDKDIYFILVDESTSFQEAYIYNEDQKVDLTDNLVVDEEVVFSYSGQDYNFPLEEGKSFYFIVVYETGGDRYVSTA